MAETSIRWIANRDRLSKRTWTLKHGTSFRFGHQSTDAVHRQRIASDEVDE